MEGTSLVWRPRTNYVAYTDLTTTTAAVILAIVGAVLATLESVIEDLAENLSSVISSLDNNTDFHWNQQYHHQRRNEDAGWKQITGYVIWVGLAFTLFLSGIQTLCIVKLIQSTDRKVPPEKALICTRFWIYFSPVYILVPVIIYVLYVIHNLGDLWLPEVFVLCGAYIGLRVVMLYIVVRFNIQLKCVIVELKRQQNQNNNL